MIGIDYSPGMVNPARELVERRGWQNVEVRRGDGSQPALEQPDLARHDVDAAIAMFAISAMPDVHTQSETSGTRYDLDLTARVIRPHHRSVSLAASEGGGTQRIRAATLR